MMRSYAQAMDGCEVVFHMASPFIVNVNDPQKELIKPEHNQGVVRATAAERKAGNGPNVKDLHAKIGQLEMENDFLAGALGCIPDASAK